jgi:DNA modification methylase
MEKRYLKSETMWEIRQGDAIEVLKTIPDQSINTCITSPPYWGLRDYGVEGQIGLEKTPEEYVSKIVEVFREVKRVLRDDGTLWLNLGDSYAGSWGNYAPTGQGGQRPKNTERWQRRAYEDKTDWRPPTSNKHKGLKPKDLVGIPWMVALALRADGWYLRSDIIWHKPNALPESVKDRPTKAHEYIFLLSKSRKYYYDADSIKEPSSDLEKSKKRYEKPFGGKKAEELLKTNQVHTRTIGMREFDGKRNKRTVWTVPTRPFPEAHFATFPPDLIEPCILAGCPEGGVVLDPFVGSGTTLLVATLHHRRSIGIELNPDYIKIAERRLKQV